MMKRKLLVPMVALLLSVGMIGVGFATWMISNEDIQQITGDDLIVAYPVEDNSITLKNVQILDGKIEFGPSTREAGTDDDVANDWLTFKESGTEDLNASIQFQIDNWSTLKQKNIVIKLSGFEIVGAEGFDGVGTHIKLPAEKTITIASGVAPEGVTTVDGETGVFKISFDFKWGADVNEENPINYFNNLGSTTQTGNTPGNRELAANFLNKIEELNGAKYKVTISAKVQ